MNNLILSAICDIAVEVFAEAHCVCIFYGGLLYINFNSITIE